MLIKQTKNDPEPVGQEGRKARQWCSVERLRLPAYFDASLCDLLYVHISTCNIFVLEMKWSIAIILGCAWHGLVILYKHDISRFVMCVIATFQKIHNATKMTLRRTRKFQTWCCYATRASLFYTNIVTYWKLISCSVFRRFPSKLRVASESQTRGRK